MKIINDIKNNIDEFLCSFYLWMFSFTRILIANYVEYSFLILLFSSITIVFLSLIFSKKTKVINITIFKIIFIVLFGFVTSYFLTPNSIIFQRAYEFIIYGVISIYLFSKINNLNKFFEYFAYLSVLSFFMHFLDPLNNYKIFRDYMSFGFNCMLLVFCGCSIGVKLFSKKIFFIIKYLSLIELALFCNKGAFVTGVFLELLFLLFKNEKSIKKIFKVVLLLLLIVMIYMFFDDILLLLINKFQQLNISSYSLTSIYKVLFGDSNGLAGRDLIWENALSFFHERPIFGNGIGAFDTKYGVYTHNIFLDILCSHGIIGLIIFIIFILKYFIKIIKSNGVEKDAYLFFIAIGVVPLIFSIYTFKWQFFWVFIYLVLKKDYIKKIRLARQEGKNEEI